MKHTLFFLLLCVISTALDAQIEIPLQSNYPLQRLYQEKTEAYPKGWKAAPNRQRECMLEDEDITYVDANTTTIILIDIDTTELGPEGTYECLNCDGNPIGSASVSGDTLFINGDDGLTAATYSFEVEYCNGEDCSDTSYEVIGRRQGQNYYPPAILLDAETSTQVTAEASLLPKPLACNKIIDAPDDYEGRGQLSYFTDYGSVDSTINYLASRYAGTDSLYVILCDSFAVCDTFHYAFQIRQDTIRFGNGGVEYFMDDFTYKGPFTNTAYWLDKETYVNDHYAEFPPSVGVATFDGLDISGTPWRGGYGDADRLTSTYIDLREASGPLHLSYWLQAKGLGLTPETEDTIKLEFRAEDGAWILMDTHYPSDTSMAGQPVDSIFIFYSQEITEEFRHQAFQFRFTATNDRLGVGDIWNLDYVRIDDEANLPIVNDVSFTTPPAGILDLYSSLPWRHFRGREEELSRSDLEVGLFNFDNAALNVGEAALRLEEEVTGTIVYQGVEILNEQSPNLVPGLNYLNPDIVSYDTQIDLFKSGTFDEEEELRFRMSYRLVGPPVQNASLGQGRDGILLNDTTSQTTVFSNYFAYDDGSAESAVAAQEGDLIAVKFTSAVDDTLRGVQFHFPHLLSDVSIQEFNIKVWIGSLEGEEDFSMNLINPVYPDIVYDTLQGFSSYPLRNSSGGLTPIALPAGDFYIAWEQQSQCDFTDCIPVGMDRNTPEALSTLFYSDGGNGFVPFPENFTPGALMVRPVVGSDTPLPTEVEAPAPPLTQLRVYPNPSSGWIRLGLSGENFGDYQLAVFSNVGQLVMSAPMQPQLDISQLENGLYILQATHLSSGQKMNARVVLAR